MNKTSNWMTAGMLSSVLLSGYLFSFKVTAQPTKKQAPKHNVIYLIGDGMGISHTSAYRYYKASEKSLVTGDQHTIEPTLFDELLVGMASTYPADTTLVTDSAASATALATGHKSYNGAIGITPDKHAHETLLERAKLLGMTTGVIATSQINHATPASFIAHIDSRRKYNEIAAQYMDSKLRVQKEMLLKTDLMLGGGTSYFTTESRDLVSEFKQLNWQYIDNINNLGQLDQLPAMGLFAEKGLPFAIDNPSLPNRLTAMTAKGLQLLESNNQPFFLMIESSQIDWCSHANDIACTMQEMVDFEETLQLVVDYAKKLGNTTIVVTADHSTGGLAMGRDGVYEWRPDLVYKIHRSAEQLADNMLSSKQVRNEWQRVIELELSDDDQENLEQLVIKGNARKLQAGISAILSKQTGTGWTTSGHTAEDVQVFAFGPYADKFRGFQDNTDIAKKLFTIIDLNK